MHRLLLNVYGYFILSRTTLVALEAESKRFAGEFESLAITGTQPLPTHCHLSSTGESYPLFPTNLTVGDGIHNAIGEIDQDER